MNTFEIGKEGELEAVQYLVNDGHQIVQRNFRLRFGEIDIIAFKEKVLYFIEVKNWKNHYIHPLESVTPKKISKMRKLAECFFSRNLEFRDGEQIISFGLITVQKQKICFYKDLF